MNTFFNRIESVKYNENDKNIFDYTKGIVSDGEDVIIYQDDGIKVTKTHVPIESINSYVDIFNNGIKDHKVDLINRLINDFDMQSNDIKTPLGLLIHEPENFELVNSSLSNDSANLNSATSHFFKNLLNLDNPSLQGKNIVISAKFKPNNKTAKKSKNNDILTVKKQKTAKKRRKKR